MLDIKVIRENPERVKAAMRSRNKDMDAAIDEILEIDAQRRAITRTMEDKKAQQNAVSARLMCMVLGFVEEGDEFFNDPKSFEDTFTPCLDDMYKVFKEFHRKIKYNARHDLPDMIT